MSGNRGKRVDDGGYSAALDAYRAGDYVRVAQLLQKAQAESAVAGDATMARILGATQHLCRACAQYGAEIDWYERARGEVQARENAVREDLGLILQMIGSHESTSAERDDRAQSALAGHHGLWERIQSLLLPTSRAAAELADGTHSSTAIAAEAPVDAKTADPQSAPSASIDDAAEPRTKPRSLAIYCLGPFKVYQNEQPIHDWPNSKSKTLFKYLVTHRQRPITKEVLMELFWPNVDPDHARNSLNVAIYRVRQALSTGSSFPHILFQDNRYLLNPDLEVHVDVETFLAHVERGQTYAESGNDDGMIDEYKAAEALYRGEFLEEDRYEAWIAPIRERLQKDYLKLLDAMSRFYFQQEDYESCVGTCNKVLAVDACQEEAHRLMMRCYSRQKRTNLAVRQFHNCVDTLKRELGVVPSLSTVEMYQRIRNCHPV